MTFFNRGPSATALRPFATFRILKLVVVFVGVQGILSAEDGVDGVEAYKVFIAYLHWGVVASTPIVTCGSRVLRVAIMTFVAFTLHWNSGKGEGVAVTRYSS